MPGTAHVVRHVPCGTLRTRAEQDVLREALLGVDTGSDRVLAAHAVDNGVAPVVAVTTHPDPEHPEQPLSHGLDVIAVRSGAPSIETLEKAARAMNGNPLGSIVAVIVTGDAVATITRGPSTGRRVTLVS